jgi:broad specificity phosphatase PhoE
MDRMDSAFKPTRFGLLRHAPTEWNQQKRIQGQTDSPLIPAGRARAAAWGKQLNGYAWDRIIASDLGRASDTADLVNQALEVSCTKETRLREQDWGAWTGKTIKEAEKAYRGREAERVGEGWAFCPPGGESRRTVRERGCRALEAAAVRWPGETILVVTHEGVIKCLVYWLLGRQFLPSEPPLFKGRCLHWLRWDGKGLEIEEVNAVVLD